MERFVPRGPVKRTSQSYCPIVKDPNLVKNRVFFGNLPTCNRDQLESICAPYGRVLGSLVQKNFGFVQFETEEIANRAAAALNRSLFKSHTITVRNAGSKKQVRSLPIKRTATGISITNTGTSVIATATGAGTTIATATNTATVTDNTNSIITATVSTTGSDDTNTNTSVSATIAGTTLNANIEKKKLLTLRRSNPHYNDCEIIVVDRENTKYAELIEARLKKLNLKVDVLFPNADVALGKVLTNISARACPYAILVTKQHEKFNSITVHILYDQPVEHRNMPIDDAIKLIANDFRAKISKDLAVQHSTQTPSSKHSPSLDNCHPRPIQFIFKLLVNNMSLTVLQYEHIIKYLQDRRILQVNVDMKKSISGMRVCPDPEIELQKKILNILNKPSVADRSQHLLFPNVASIKEDKRALQLIRDRRVQKALDLIMDSNLVTTISNIMKY